MNLNTLAIVWIRESGLYTSLPTITPLGCTHGQYITLSYRQTTRQDHINLDIKFETPLDRSDAITSPTAGHHDPHPSRVFLKLGLATPQPAILIALQLMQLRSWSSRTFAWT